MGEVRLDRVTAPTTAHLRRSVADGGADGGTVPFLISPGRHPAAWATAIHRRRRRSGVLLAGKPAAACSTVDTRDASGAPIAALASRFGANAARHLAATSPLAACHPGHVDPPARRRARPLPSQLLASQPAAARRRRLTPWARGRHRSRFGTRPSACDRDARQLLLHHWRHRLHPQVASERPPRRACRSPRPLDAMLAWYARETRPSGARHPPPARRLRRPPAPPPRTTCARRARVRSTTTSATTAPRASRDTSTPSPSARSAARRRAALGPPWRDGARAGFIDEPARPRRERVLLGRRSTARLAALRRCLPRLLRAVVEAGASTRPPVSILNAGDVVPRLRCPAPPPTSPRLPPPLAGASALARPRAARATVAVPSRHSSRRLGLVVFSRSPPLPRLRDNDDPNRAVLLPTDLALGARRYALAPYACVCVVMAVAAAVLRPGVTPPAPPRPLPSLVAAAMFSALGPSPRHHRRSQPPVDFCSTCARLPST